MPYFMLRVVSKQMKELFLSFSVDQFQKVNFNIKAKVLTVKE